MPWYNASTNSFEGGGTLGARNYESARGASSNSAAKSISKVAAYTGTNTGKTYEVGKSYSMNGDAYTAQRDGTFKNNRTGQVIEGSSNSNTATFFAAPARNGGSGPGSAQVGSGGAAERSGGPGNAGAITRRLGTGTGVGKPGSITGMPTRTGTRLKSPFGAGPGSAEILSAADRMFPSRIVLDTSMPNVEDFWEPRYGEPGEFIGGGVNAIVDAHANDKAGEVDKAVRHVLEQSIHVRPGSPADHAIRFVDNAVKSDWGKFQRNNFFISDVEAPRDGGGWAPKW